MVIFINNKFCYCFEKNKNIQHNQPMKISIYLSNILLLKNLQQSQLNTFEDSSEQKMSRVKHQTSSFVFSLIGEPDSYYNSPTYASFDPNFEKDDFSSSSSSSSSECSNFENTCKSIIPTFNNDRLFFTPSFYLPSQKIKLSHFQEKMIKKERKYEQIEEEFIMIPKPRKRPYCHSCQIWYGDYLEHITNQDHQQKAILHPMHMQIERLCLNINQKNATNDEKERADDFLVQNKQQ